MFYTALNEDCLFLKNKGFSFKITNINNSDIKCGFPISSRDKYNTIFKNDGFDYKFVDNFEIRDFTKEI